MCDPGVKNGRATLTLDPQLRPAPVGGSVFLFNVTLNNNAVLPTPTSHLRVQPLSVAPAAPAGAANPGNGIGAAMQFNAATGRSRSAACC